MPAPALAKLKKPSKCTTKLVAVGEFIRTFEFDVKQPQLPIVQPGGFVIFPIATVPPINVRYIEDEERVGVLVPSGTYRVLWALNPSSGASVTLLVNGKAPRVANGFLYTALTSPEEPNAERPIVAEHLVVASRKRNLISLVNSGTTLFTLGDLPNTRQGKTAVLTQVLVQRVGGVHSRK